MIADLEKLILEASTSFDEKRLEELSKNPSMTVRRAVARNMHTPSYILRELTTDIAINVRYKALENKNCRIYETLSKEDLSRKCVTCDVPEIETLSRCSEC